MYRSNQAIYKSKRSQAESKNCLDDHANGSTRFPPATPTKMKPGWKNKDSSSHLV